MNGHKPYAFTVSDSQFTPRTVAMIQSFRAFDSKTPFLCVITDKIEGDLRKLAKSYNFELIHLEEIIPSKVLDIIQASRSFIEQMWTYPSVILNSLMSSKSDYSDILYLDADLYFFGDSRILWNEIPLGKIGVVEHKFSSRLAEIFIESGNFNVSWVSIPTTTIGMRCAEEWAQNCINLCPSVAEYHNNELVYGDQGYLNSWPLKYPNSVSTIQHLGAGVAPWNFEQYEITKDDGSILIDGVPLIFYHFSSHQFGFLFARKMGTEYSKIRKYPELIYSRYEHNLLIQAKLLNLDNWKSRYRPLLIRILDNFKLKLKLLAHLQN